MGGWGAGDRWILAQPARSHPPTPFPPLPVPPTASPLPAPPPPQARARPGRRRPHPALLPRAVAGALRAAPWSCHAAAELRGRVPLLRAHRGAAEVGAGDEVRVVLVGVFSGRRGLCSLLWLAACLGHTSPPPAHPPYTPLPLHSAALRPAGRARLGSTACWTPAAAATAPPSASPSPHRPLPPLVLSAAAVAMSRQLMSMVTQGCSKLCAATSSRER